MHVLLKAPLAFAARTPALAAPLCGVLRAALRLGGGALRGRPERFLAAYRAVRFVHRRLGPPPPSSPEATGAAARAWRRLDDALHEQVRRWFREEADEARVRRVNHALAAYEADERVERMKAFPWRANIELTSKCNLRCRMCPQATVEALTVEHLDPAVLDAIEPALRRLEHVTITGFGETFVHKEFRAFFSAVKRPGLAVRIITNGVLLNESLARFLVEGGLDELWVSLDAVQPETYRFVRGVDRLERIREQLRALSRLKREIHGLPEDADVRRVAPVVSLSFVAMRRNIDELPDFVEQARALDAVAVYANYLIVYDESMREESLYHDQERANRRLREAAERAEAAGVAYFGPPAFGATTASGRESAQRGAREGYRACREPWEFAYFNCTGHVVPCCTEYARLGDLSKDSFETIWNAEPYRRYRRSLSGDAPSKFCRNCMQTAYRGVDEVEAHLRLMDADGRLL